MSKKEKISVLLLGLRGSGKSSLVQRWLHPFEIPSCSETLAIEVTAQTIQVDDINYTVRFWDTAGAYYYDNLLEAYLYNTDCSVVVFDVTSLDSWSKAKYWVNKIVESNAISKNDVPICIVSNKIDLESQRRVHKADVKKYIGEIASNRIVYCEASALTGENTKLVYQLILNFTKKPMKKVWTRHDVNPPSHTSQSNCLIV